MLKKKVSNFFGRIFAASTLLTYKSCQAAAYGSVGSGEIKKEYDVAVIGGGSGGIAFAFEARRLGLEVILFDYVKPTPHGTRWGIGGTCVNVGCIPKKLLHQAAILHESIKNSYDYGWNLGINAPENHGQLLRAFSWEQLIERVGMYIKSLNFGYKSNLLKRGVQYVNSIATLKDQNTIFFTKDRSILEDFLKTGQPPVGKQDEYGMVKAKKILIATGSRPTYLASCKNKELAITSDDIFWQKKPPGKTLIVGGGYVAV